MQDTGLAIRAYRAVLEDREKRGAKDDTRRLQEQQRQEALCRAAARVVFDLHAELPIESIHVVKVAGEAVCSTFELDGFVFEPLELGTQFKREYAVRLVGACKCGRMAGSDFDIKSVLDLGYALEFDRPRPMTCGRAECAS